MVIGFINKLFLIGVDGFEKIDFDYCFGNGCG